MSLIKLCAHLVFIKVYDKIILILVLIKFRCAIIYDCKVTKHIMLHSLFLVVTSQAPHVKFVFFCRY